MDEHIYLELPNFKGLTTAISICLLGLLLIIPTQVFSKSSFNLKAFSTHKKSLKSPCYKYGFLKKTKCLKAHPLCRVGDMVFSRNPHKNCPGFHKFKAHKKGRKPIVTIRKPLGK